MEIHSGIARFPRDSRLSRSIISADAEIGAS